MSIEQASELTGDQWDFEFVGRYGAAREEGATKREAWDRAEAETTGEFGPRPELADPQVGWLAKWFNRMRGGR